MVLKASRVKNEPLLSKCQKLHNQAADVSTLVLENIDAYIQSLLDYYTQHRARETSEMGLESRAQTIGRWGGKADCRQNGVNEEVLNPTEGICVRQTKRRASCCKEIRIF